MTIVSPFQVNELIDKGRPFLCDNELLLDMTRLSASERLDEFEAFNLSCCGKSSKINFISEEIAKSFPSRNKSWYDKTVYLPFENLLVPAPTEYEPNIPYYLYQADNINR